MTKIDIISGFLGSGKTTLIMKILKESLKDEKVVLIENEFGKVSVDGGFLKESGIEIKEIVSGCICCTLVGDFYYGVRDIIEQFHPDRILIEPSGVGKLSDVMSSVVLMKDKGLDVRLNMLITVVNGERVIKQLKAFGEFLRNQVEHASVIILSRTQNMDEQAVLKAVEAIRGYNEYATIITTPWDQLKAQQIIDAAEHQESLADQLIAEAKEHAHQKHMVLENAGEHDHEHHHHDHDEHEHHHEHDHEHEHHDHDHEDHEHHHDHDHEHHHHHHDHDHDADEVFVSWGVETPKKYKKERIAEILKAFAETDTYGTVLRAKGMIESEEGPWIYFDMVPGEYELREGAPDYTGRLCVIGTDIDPKQMDQLFS